MRQFTVTAQGSEIEVVGYPAIADFSSGELSQSVEALMTPVTYLVVAYLKRAEQEDFYDVGTNFNPFTLEP